MFMCYNTAISHQSAVRRQLAEGANGGRCGRPFANILTKVGELKIGDTSAWILRWSYFRYRKKIACYETLHRSSQRTHLVGSIWTRISTSYGLAWTFSRVSKDTYLSELFSVLRARPRIETLNRVGTVTAKNCCQHELKSRNWTE
jgi:hypothetical protein